MNLNTKITTIDDVTSMWVKYLEIFSSSSIRISDLRSKGYSWVEMENIFKTAIKNKKEIELNTNT